MRAELRASCPGSSGPDDRFCYAEIFYAGGTVARDVSSRAGRGPAAASIGYAADHAAVVEWVPNEARPGDTVLLMGARDPRAACPRAPGVRRSRLAPLTLGRPIPARGRWT